jgi:hypothetical protein
MSLFHIFTIGFSAQNDLQLWSGFQEVIQLCSSLRLFVIPLEFKRDHIREEYRGAQIS